MRKILENLALIHLIEYGKRNLINMSGTHLVKNGRGFNWSLVKDETRRAMITIQFNKTSVPTFTLHDFIN